MSGAMRASGLRFAALASILAIAPGCATMTEMGTSVQRAFASLKPADAGSQPPPGSAAEPRVQATAANAAHSDTPQATAADHATADPHAPGQLHIILPDSPWGTEGWRIEVSAAKTQPGFKPVRATPRIGYHARLQLLPDSYLVKVGLRGDERFSEWVQIQADRATVVYIDLGLLHDTVKVLEGQAAEQRLAEAMGVTNGLNLRQTFEPLRIALGDSSEGRWYGPRSDDRPRGRGVLELFQQQRRIGQIDDAQADPEGFTGTPAFEDGRQVDGRWQGLGLIDGSVTRYPDGRVFKGNYAGAAPAAGQLEFPDGKTWQGDTRDGTPAGQGTLTLADGTIIHDVPGEEIDRLDGVFTCTVSGRRIPCAYFEGEKMASAAEYQRRNKARDLAAAREVAQAQELDAQRQASAGTGKRVEPMSSSGLADAVAAAERLAATYNTGGQGAPRQPPAPPVSAGSAPAQTGPVSGCSAISGRFSTSTGLSRLVFNANGSGSLWQQTYGGGRTYTFDVDFRWQGSANSMQFEYGEAVYRDAGGSVMNRRSLAGGSASCSYNGRELTIGGTTYYRQ